MSAAAQKRMNADEFLAWAMEQPEGAHYELVAGQVVAMAPERATHGRIKARLARFIGNAIDAAGLPCETYIDSMAVRVNADTIYEPDVMVRCGTPLDENAIEVTDPLIIIEVVSPSSARRDTGSKLADYLSIASVRHYLIVTTGNPAIIHHRRDDTGAITTAILRDGAVQLDPPGIALSGIFDGL
jgi:Uma2 family endonuclease